MKENDNDYVFIEIDMDTLEKFHLFQHNIDGKCKKYWVRLNETNIEQLIQSIRHRLKEQGDKRPAKRLVRLRYDREEQGEK